MNLQFGEMSKNRDLLGTLQNIEYGITNLVKYREEKQKKRRERPVPTPSKVVEEQPKRKQVKLQPVVNTIEQPRDNYGVKKITF